MNILHITRERGSDIRYGIRKSLIPIIEAFKAKGHQVEIFDHKLSTQISSSKFELWLESVYLRFMHRKFREEGELAWQILIERVIIGRKAAKYAAVKNISHVHCHDPLLGYTYSLFAFFYGATKCWGYTAHAFGRYVKLRVGITSSKKSIFALQRWEKKAALNAKWVFAPIKIGLTQMMYDLSLKTLPSNWHFVPHAVIKKTGNRNLCRKSLYLEEDQKLLLGVGQLIPMKRFSLLLEAIVLLPDSLKPYVLILGEGPEKEALKLQAEQLGLSERFEIRVTDNIGKFFSAADIYISVSSTESFGMANCEAVLAGVPSVCTAVDAIPELLSQCAVMINDKPVDIAFALMKLLTSEPERNNLVKQANSISRLWPDQNKIALMMEQIYERCKT
ncbi:MAG: glycosyltransferase family 4 protein [Bacteroidota bacterium]|nr:glycosyltransferase family 4 protein [Bacteroidota bacterium]